MITINASMKERLGSFYRETDAPIDTAAKARVLMQMSGEAAHVGGRSIASPSTPFWRFLVGQLRFVSPLAWIAQIAVLAGMFAVVGLYGKNESSVLVVMAAGVLSVAISIPSVFKSCETGVSELEASCFHDTAQVLASRLILFGLADVLWLTASLLIVPATIGMDPFRVFLYAATPYFAYCALCCYLSRRMSGNCAKPCIVAAACVIAALWVLNEAFFGWYSEVSIVVWAVALFAAIALAAYEMRRLLAQISARNLPRTVQTTN